MQLSPASPRCKEVNLPEHVDDWMMDDGPWVLLLYGVALKESGLVSPRMFFFPHILFVLVWMI